MHSFAQHWLSYIYNGITFYLVLVCLFYFLSDYVIFQPPAARTYPTSSNFLTIDLPNNEKLAAVYYHQHRSDYTILFSHGNAEDIGTIQSRLFYYAEQGFSVIAYDYEGYGLSTGKPSEKATYRDIQAVYHYLRDSVGIPAHQIIIHGSSLGTGPSVDLASHFEVGGVILEAPFVSAYRVQTRFPIIPFDKFNNLKKIRNINAPLLIIHGTQDSIIPIWHGKKLYEQANQPKTWLAIEKADHNNLIDTAGALYWQSIHQFITHITEENRKK